MKTYTRAKVNILRKRENEPWIYSYADLVTNLLAFFLMLLIVMTSSKTSKADLVEGLEHYVKGRARGMGTVKALDEAGLDDFRQIVHDYIVEHSLAAQVSLESHRGGLELRFEGALVFDSGTAEIREDAKPVLAHIARLAERLPSRYVLDVEGHADRRPISSRVFPSNWELSSARAGSVVRFFAQEGVAAARMRAIGYADTKPIDSTGEGEENRRVVVKIDSLGRRDG